MKFLYRNQKKYYLKTENKPDDIIFSALAYLEKEIRNAEINNIHKNGYALSFNANIFRYIWNGFNTFNPVSHAKFLFSANKDHLVLDMEISFIEIFFTVLLFSPLAVVAYFLRGWEYSLIIISALFLIYAFTVVITNFRLKYMLFKIISVSDKQFNETK